MDSEFGNLFKPQKPNGKGVIYCHPGFGKLGPKALYPFALGLSIKGYTVLVLKYWGEDEGALDIMKDLEKIRDAANFLTGPQTPVPGPQHLYLIGYSRGGGFAFYAQGKFPSLFEACVSVAGPTDLKIYAKIQNPEAKKFIDYFITPYPIDMAKDLRAKPLLLVYGTQDDLVPPSQGSRMATAVDSEKCRIIYVQHGHDLLNYKDTMVIIAQWLDKL